MAPRRGATRRVAVGLGAVLLIVVVIALFPRGRLGLGFCAGHSGHASTGTRYAISVPVQGHTVLAAVDFDGHLWRAVGDRVTTNGLVPRGATSLEGSIFLVNTAQATFSSTGAFATLLPLTEADGCTVAQVARAGAPQRTTG